MDIIIMMKAAIAWVTSRLKERTSWDGAVLIAAGVAFLLFKSIAVIAAWIAIAYGIWTIITEED